jgi:predicted RNA binding protein YcfA (HicA-like mRNA interferase family)
MSRLPRPTGKELIAVLAKVGFDVARVRGSHLFVRRRDGRAAVVPVHRGETIGPGLLNKDCEVNAYELATLS